MSNGEGYFRFELQPDTYDVAICLGDRLLELREGSVRARATTPLILAIDAEDLPARQAPCGFELPDRPVYSFATKHSRSADGSP